MATVVSVTPLPVDRDSRTFKFAASFARFGHESIVVEGMPSAIDRDRLPFELRSVGRVTDADEGAGAGESGPVLSGLRRMAEPPIALAANLRWNLRTWRRLPEADLYQLHSYNQFLAVQRKARAVGAPYIYDAHDSYWEAGPEIDADHRARLTRRAFERLERRCARNAAALSTVSDGVAELLERRFQRRPAVIRNFQDSRLDEPAEGDVRTAAGVPEDAFLLVVAGNAKPGDAIEEALIALESLPARVHLALVGRGHERFKTFADGGGVGERVHILPPVAPTEVTDFIRSADASPILYRAWTINFQHALPNRFSHAVAAGLPVLYPPLTEIRKLGERYGLGIEIDPTDPGSIAAGVRALSESPDRLADYGRRVREAAAELSWEGEEQRIRSLLESGLAGGGR